MDIYESIESMISSGSVDVFEGMTSISAVIRSVCEGISDRKIISVLFDTEKFKKKRRSVEYLNKMSKVLNFNIRSVDSSTISNISFGDTHGGIVAVCSKRTFFSMNVNYLTNQSFFVMIDGIEDPYNFGYSVRSLYAAGADGIILPSRNWLELAGIVARSSAGTSELANIYVGNLLETAKMLKGNGFKIVCAEIRDSDSVYDFDFNQPILLVVGGEKRGISRKILDISDVNVRIDYGRDFMGSLPTASAVSVIAFEVNRQRKFLN